MTQASKSRLIARSRSIAPARHEEMATVARIEALYHRPYLLLRQRIDGCVELAVRCIHVMRIVRSIKEPSLKCESRRVDEIETVLDRKTNVATIQKRIHQTGVVALKSGAVFM